MNSPLPLAVLIGLALVLVAMFALGFYWLASKDRSAHPRSPAPPQPDRGGAQRPTFDADEIDEWGAFAPYPGHVVHAAHAARADSRDAYPPFGRYEEPACAPDMFDARHELHDAIESYVDEPSKPEPPIQPATSSSPSPAIRCPRCLSTRIDTLNRGRKAGCTIGSVAGATSGMAMALTGAETGMTLGFMAGPIGSVFGGIAGAIIAGLVGSTAGCAAGSAIGEALDEKVLDNHRCLACGHAFSSSPH
ncbi:hypothetical protein [Burkholderia ubonensis]|uniref:hypothetical protein n=1 Tax=Burkholderia ubonensis TaxID=101571 RepID=UPI0021A9B4B3|nr:hypothetical protein [Burkholderia ubonensis]